MNENTLERSTTSEGSISDTGRDINQDKCQEKGPEHEEKMELGTV